MREQPVQSVDTSDYSEPCTLTGHDYLLLL